VRRADLPETVRFHDLRHTCASLLLSANTNPKVVSEMLGHATVAITLDVYAHVMPDMQEDAASTIAGMLHHEPSPLTGLPPVASSDEGSSD
jgi:integrase